MSERQRAILVAMMESAAQPLNAYAIVKALRNPDGRCMFNDSSVYRDIERLVDWGCLESDEQQTPRGPLRTYALTMKAVESVRDWVRTPAKIPLDVCKETWLRIASVRFSRPRDVLDSLSPLADELEGRSDELELRARIARRTGRWDTAAQLDYTLERAALDACQRWVGEATRLLEARVEELSHASQRQ